MSQVNRISIRSYTKTSQSHSHKYHQLVLPLHGAIELAVGSFSGLATVGDCIRITAGEIHTFKADKNARFVVVDTDILPENIINSPSEIIKINTPLLTFIQFIESQLNHQIHPKIESASFTLFYDILSQQPFSNNRDKRLNKVLSYINENLANEISNTQLAKIACLSITQFKKVFKENISTTTQQYITQQRMNKAKTLLTHTDAPIAIVAEQVGYQSSSAFARKFKMYFGSSPKHFKR